VIGTLLPERATCGETHLPGCYNPHVDETFCICGTQRWPGRVGVVISTPRHELDTGRLGWDTYQLHVDGCPLRDDVDGHLSWHVCEVAA
jgi:hypothetical protein